MNIKQTKKDALARLSGKWPKALVLTLIYILIIFTFTYVGNYCLSLATNAPILQVLIDLVILGISLPLSFGVTATFVDLSKGKDVSYTEFINKSILNFSKVWRVTFAIALKIILPIILFTIAVIVITMLCTSMISTSAEDISLGAVAGIFSIAYLAIMIFAFVKFLPYALSFLVLANEPDKTAKEIIETSTVLMENKKLEYLLLILSFFGWLLLIALVAMLVEHFTQATITTDIIANIGAILLSPYILVSQIVYYEKLANKSDKDTTKNEVKEDASSENK